MADLSLTEARRRFGALVRRTATTRERVTITARGEPAAVLVNAQELADLEEALAVANHRMADADQATVPQTEVRRRLGLPRE
jgi:prevent-host-death family protein